MVHSQGVSVQVSRKQGLRVAGCRQIERQEVPRYFLAPFTWR